MNQNEARESYWTPLGNTELLEVPGGRLYRRTGSEHMTFVPDPLLSEAARNEIERATKHLPSLAILAHQALERPSALTSAARQDLADFISCASKIAWRILKGLA